MLYVISVVFALAQVCAVQVEAKLYPSQPQPTAFFGWSVDMTAGRVAVGSPGHQAPWAGTRGAVYIFEKVGVSWVPQAVLGASPQAGGPFPGPDFGTAVALDGDSIAASAPNSHVSNSAPRGKVFVFRKQGASWVEELVIDNLTMKLSRPFGTRLDLEGDTLLIGSPAPFGAYVTNSPTIVYIFHRSPVGWTLQGQLQPQDEVEADYFGWSLAVRGDTAFIGSPGNPESLPYGVSGISRGAVYVYQRTGASWALRQVLTASDGKLGDRFGSAVSVSGNTLLITAPRVKSSQLPAVGAAYLFNWNGSAWVEQERFLVHGGTPAGMAGQMASLDGDIFVMSGLGFWDQAVGGAFHLFFRIGARWTESLKLSPADGKNSDNFSFSGSVNGNTIAIGSPRNDGLASEAGAVYIYSVQTSSLQPSYYCTPKPSAHCIPRIVHWGQPSVSGAMAGEKYEVWGWEVAFNQWGMLVYSVTGPASTPFKGGTLCLNPPIGRTKLQPSKFHNGLQEPCYTTFQYDFNERIKSGVDPALQAGQQVWLQYWSRDKTFAPPNNVGLTDAVTAIICQ